MNATAPFVDAAFLANPYPAYQALREAGPLHWSTEFFGGAWLLTRHADVEQVLRDPRFSAQRTGGWVTNREETKGELAGFQQLFARAMLFLDAPDHTRIRKVLNAGFKPAQIQALEPFIAQTVAELLDAVGDAPRFDFMQAVARQLPTRVIAKMMGIEEAANADFAVWSDDLAVFIGAPLATHQQARRAQASLLAMGRYFEKLIAERRQNPGDDLVSRLLQAEVDGALHNHAELLAQCAMLLFAGHETTRNLLATACNPCWPTPTSGSACNKTPAWSPAPCASCCASTARCSTPAAAWPPNCNSTARPCAGATWWCR
ncbi:hypothetical protein [Rhodoferax sp.]|uniref:hypothetical protein n=1 Tax=Rhodoferax sp. TaxID=50421 RepID=UPI0025F69504|nr:hypothetical protein [Rhodoferax sp.]